MNLKTIAAVAIALAFPAAAQTAAEQLQKGIFAQESAGKADEAILIYRQLANSSLTPRPIAAEAQYRLSMALLQKGDLSNATREMERLERDFSDHSELVRTLAARLKMTAPVPGTPPSSFVEFDPGAFTTVTGTVEQVLLVNPLSWVHLTSGGQKYWVQLTSPNSMVQGGMTRTTLKLGEVVTVRGVKAKDGSATIQAVTVMAGNGQAIFDRAKFLEAAKAAGPPGMVGTAQAVVEARRDLEALHAAARAAALANEAARTRAELEAAASKK